MDALDFQEDVEQLFRDVFKENPASRPTAMDLLQKPVISSAHEYVACFDEYYDSEDAEEVDSIPPQTADFSSLDIDAAHEVAHISSSSHQSLHSVEDIVGELPQFDSQNLMRGRGGSQDSGVGADLDNSVNSSLFGVQLSMRSSSSGSGTGQSQLLHQDSGLEDMPGGECPLPDRPDE